MSNGETPVDTGEPTSDNAPFRTSHIFRVYQNDDPNSDVWIDVERIDELWRDTTKGRDGQASHWFFDWKIFVPEEAAKKRITDPNDDSNYIDVPIRENYFVRSDIGGQASLYRFINDDTNKGRETHSRRIYFHEIKEGYLVDGKPPSDPEQYFNSLGEQDTDQYVDVEVIDRLWSAQKRLRDIHGHRIKTFQGLLAAIHQYTQKKKWISADTDRLLHEPLLSSDSADPNFVSKKNPDEQDDLVHIDPPWRLDPIQIIVNVSWSSGLAAIFGPGTEDAPSQDKSQGETGR